MNVYALNNYSEDLSGHELEVISGSGSMNCLYIAHRSGGDYKFTSGHKKDFCELKLLPGNNPVNCFIARESGESYSVPKLPERELASDSTGHLSRLSDSALVARLESLRGKERKIQLNILLYIIELEKRKLYLPRGYNSLFEFCTRHLKYSASAAMRRIKASRCIKNFPAISTMLLDGEINLTSISKIAKIITKENYRDLLKEIKNMPTRGVERVVARYSPRDSYYDTIKPIFLRTSKKEGSDRETAGLKETKSGKKVTTGAGTREMDFSSEANTGLNLSCGYKDNKNEPEDSERPILEEKFKLQFAVDPEFMKRLKKIQSLLSTRYPEGVNLEKVFNILMEEYLDRHSPEKRIQRREKRENKKQKKQPVSNTNQSPKSIHHNNKQQNGLQYNNKEIGNISKKQKKQDSSSDKQSRSNNPSNNKQQNGLQYNNKEIGNINNKNKKTTSRDNQPQGNKTNTSKNKQPPVGKGVSSKQKKGRENRRGITKETRNGNNKILKTNKQRIRNIPAAVRDEVFTRDGGRCTFVGKNGMRCNSTWNLEIDHIVPFAKGGDNSPENLRLLCAKHNLMEAEKVYGKNFMKKFYPKE